MNKMKCIQCGGKEKLLKFGYLSAEKMRICEDCLNSNMYFGKGYRRCGVCGKIYRDNIDMRPLLKDGIGYYLCMFCEHNRKDWNTRKGYGIKLKD